MITTARDGARLHELEQISHEAGHSFMCQLPDDVVGDTPDHPTASNVELFEDGRALGAAHSEHAQIRAIGRGLYSHWGQHLYFSSSDNSDPRRNRRRYHAYIPSRASKEPQHIRLEAIAQRLSDQTTEWDRYGIAEALFYEAFPHAFIGEFGKACWDDEPFASDYVRLVPGNRRSFERKYVVAQLVRSLKHVPGDLAECGVYNGATAYFMAQATRDVGIKRKLHLFDSFSGLSRPAAEDGTYWHEGALALPESVARETLESFPDTSFYRGWIPDRFAEVADGRFAFVHIDVDLYQPTLDSIAFFYSRVPSGGMIVCDDYGFTTCPGARQAIREFMADKREEIIDLPTGQGLIIRV